MVSFFNPLYIVIAILVLLVVVVLIKKIFKVIAILVVIGLLVLVMYPKECGFEIGNEVKDCSCLGYTRMEGRIELCYGFCRNCKCGVLEEGNLSLVDCGSSEELDFNVSEVISGLSVKEVKEKVENFELPKFLVFNQNF